MRAQSRAQRLRRGIVLVGVVLILAFAASSAFDVWRSYEQSLEAVDRELSNLAKALAAEAERRFQSIDVVLRDAESWFGTRPRRLSPSAAAEVLGRLGSGLPVAAIYITDAAGNLVYSSDPLPPEVVSAAPRNLVLLDGHHVLVISRELRDARAPAGRVNALLQLSAFRELYDAVELSPGNTIALYSDDGTLLARRPNAPERIGWKFEQWLDLVEDIRQQEQAAPKRAPVVASPVDGRLRFRSLAPVRGFPFSVMTTREETDRKSVV